MKKFISYVAMFAIMACLVSCGGGEQPDGGKVISLTYSGTASDQTFNEGLFELFKAERKAAGDNNTYKITYVAHGPDKVDSEILDWSSPDAPDVYEAASDKIGILYSKGALAKLSSTYASWIDSEMSTLGKQLATFNGSYYNFPYTGDNTYYLQYDKSVFGEEDVKTIEGLLDKAAELEVQVGYNLKEAFWGGAVMFTFGADYEVTYDADGNYTTDADFDSEAGLKGAKAILKIMSHSAWINQAGVPASDSLVKATIAGTWDIASYKEALGDNYACAPMPTVTIDGETASLGCFLGGKFLGVNPQRSAGDTDRLVAAFELAKFLSGYTAQTKRYEELNIYPCIVSAQNHPSMATDPNIQVLKQQSEFAHAQTAVPAEFWNAPATMTGTFEEWILNSKAYTEDEVKAACKIFNDAVKGVKQAE